MGPPTAVQSAIDGGERRPSSSATASAVTPSSSSSSSRPTSAAASALSLLLREDPLLSRHGLTTVPSAAGVVGAGGNDDDDREGDDEAAFSYAASLLHQDGGDGSGWMSSTGDVQRRAEEALAEVDRKLALVGSLAERVSRESPADVAGPLLRLHGYDATVQGGGVGGGGPEEEDDDEQRRGGAWTEGGGGTSSSSSSSLAATRERCDRLRRRGEVLEGVSRRVESTLSRGLRRMESATSRLGRVLELSATLKMAMRLRFEARKVLGSGLDFDELHANASAVGNVSAPHYAVDLRDLTRAAASVAAMEELLSSPELVSEEPSDGGGGGGVRSSPIHAVESMRPEAERIASAVRRAAAEILAEQQQQRSSSSSNASGGAPSASKLGATLQVYFHLGELPQATWGAVEAGLASAEKASSQFFNPAAVQRLLESAQTEAKALVESEEKEKESDPTSDGGGGTAQDKKKKKKQSETAYARALKKKLREKKAEAAARWAAGVADASLRVWSLHRVLARKSDPSTRRNFLEVVSESPVPEKFRQAERALLLRRNDAGGGGNGGGGGKNKKKDESVGRAATAAAPHSIFALFWNQMCIGLGVRIQRLLKYDGGSLARDVAALYPPVRAAALDMLGGVRDAMQAAGVGAVAAAAASSRGGSSGAAAAAAAAAAMMLGEDGTGVVGGVGPTGGGGGEGAGGILGGSSGLDDAFLGWGGGGGGSLGGVDRDDGPAGIGADGAAGGGADAWTWSDPSFGDGGASADAAAGGVGGPSSAAGGGVGGVATNPSPSSASLSAVFNSSEWAALRGSGSTGLHPLQRAFLEASSERLCSSLQYMFPEAVTVDENGVAMPVLPALPSRYDLAKLDATVREELSSADPREGGGELSMTTMISENVVDMVERFCDRAGGATSDVGEDGVLNEDGTATEALVHDLKVAGVMSALATSLRNAPENAFVAPYRPAQSPQHEEASHMCQIALLPALHEIEGLVKSAILDPLCRALNARVGAAIGKIHRGTYAEDNRDGAVVDPMAAAEEGGFVRQHLSAEYDSIAANHLAKLPSEYASIVASTVATHSIYCYVSNASLVRPLGETGRLRITQDLADFELALEQLVFKAGSSATLSGMDNGRPYAELRAVRQMLYWTGLEDKSLPPGDVAKAMLREVWVKDVRPSTVFHFLLSFAPNLLSSPHHAKRMKAEEYVNLLVKLDGSVDDGEATSWMTTMAACDSYQQRESVEGRGGGFIDGDRRIAAVLMMLGPELLRRRRH